MFSVVVLSGSATWREAHLVQMCHTDKHLQIHLEFTCEVYFFPLQVLATVCQFESLAFDQTLNQQLSKRLPGRHKRKIKSHTHVSTDSRGR